MVAEGIELNTKEVQQLRIFCDHLCDFEHVEIERRSRLRYLARSRQLFDDFGIRNLCRDEGRSLLEELGFYPDWVLRRALQEEFRRLLGESISDPCIALTIS
jgi:predicted ATPase